MVEDTKTSDHRIDILWDAHFPPGLSTMKKARHKWSAFEAKTIEGNMAGPMVPRVPHNLQVFSAEACSELRVML